ncbi:MAG: hypothetical protein U0694_03595 [Anaerolineae bacterium]
MMRNRKLKQLYDFTEADLEANRQGHLTPRQRLVLQSKNKGNQIGAAVLFLLFLGMALLGIYQVGMYFMNPVGSLPALWTLLAVFGVILTVAIPLASRRESNTLEADLKTGHLEQMAGMGWREKRVVRTRNGKQTYYYVRVGQFNMGMVSEDVYEAYLSEHYYRLYYLPRSRRVVAVENIDLSEVNAPPQKPKSKNDSNEQTPLSKQTSYLVYSLRGEGTYTAAIKWYAAQGQPPKVAWQQQGSDAQVLHQQALQHLPKVQSDMQNQGWDITTQKDEGEIAETAAFRRVYTMEHVTDGMDG